jgi:hypothetical protein
VRSALGFRGIHNYFGDFMRKWWKKFLKFCPRSKIVVKFGIFFFVYYLIVSRDCIQKIRPIREDLDAAVSSQKIIQISGQS